MKLNRECMKELLLYLEENLDYYELLRYEDVYKSLNTDLSQDEIYYSLNKLYELDCIDVNPDKVDPLKEISDITMLGHNCIRAIRTGHETVF